MNPSFSFEDGSSDTNVAGASAPASSRSPSGDSAVSPRKRPRSALEDDSADTPSDAQSDAEEEQLPELVEPTRLAFLSSVDDKLAHYREVRARRWAKKQRRNGGEGDEDAAKANRWWAYLNEGREPLLENGTVEVEVPKEKPRKRRRVNPEKDPIFEADSDGEGGGDDEPEADFMSLKLSRVLLRAIRDLGWRGPTPIQQGAVPPALAGKDLLLNAVTGSGKTGAFMLPILQRLFFTESRTDTSRVLVVTPTRELADQCMKMTQALAKYAKVKVALVVGGLSIEAQEEALRRLPDIVICTPGRMIDLVRNSGGVSLQDVEILVLDEADRLLDMGFKPELDELLSHVPDDRQTILLSATLTDDIERLAGQFLKEPERVAVDPSLCLASHLSQEFVRVHQGYEKMRKSMLLALCLKHYTSRVIVFMRTKKEAHALRLIFGMFGLKATELHGDMAQMDRLHALELFRRGHVDYLLCTDVAARGIDIKGVKTVINIEFPTSIKTYIHRVGRTARAGREGQAVTLVGEKRRKLLKRLVNSTADCSGMKSRTIDSEFVGWVFAQIADMKQETTQLSREENAEREMRLAHIQLSKSENLVRHGDAIASRGKKTWHMTAQEKKKLRKAALESELGEEYVQEMRAKIERRIKLTAERKERREQRAAQQGQGGRPKRKPDVNLEREEKIRRKQKEKHRRQRELGFAQRVNQEAVAARRAQKKAERKANRVRWGAAKDDGASWRDDLGDGEDTGRRYASGRKRGNSRIDSQSRKEMRQLHAMSDTRSKKTQKRFRAKTKRKTIHKNRRA